MAERSSELDEGTEIEVSKANKFDKTSGASDDTYLESRSTEDSLDDDEIVDTTDDASDSDETSDDATDETEKIRTDIVETRSQLSETIDAIQEKLSFSNISEQVKDEVTDHINSALQTAKDSVYDATLGKVGNVMNYINKGMNELSEVDVVRSARKNPLAISLIGLGLGMLVMNSFSSKKQKSYRYKNDYDYDREDDFQRREFSSRDNQSSFAGVQSKVSDAAGKVGETVSGAAGKVGETVTGAAGAVSETVTDVAGKAYKQVGNLGSQVKDVAGSAQDQYEYYIEENPLAVGAVALALGAAVGMSIPSTRFEGELMGETRDNLMQKAQETARGAIDKVQQVAGNVTETVKHAAGDVVQSVKDSAGDVVQTVKDGAGDVTKTVTDEAKKQGLT